MHTAGRTGFSGLKGCIGAEFLMQDSPLTTEQCEDTELGLSEMEANVFLSPDGGSLWCGCNQVANGPESFCEGDDVSLSTLAGASASKHKYICTCVSAIYVYLAQLAVCTAFAF